MSKFKKGDKVVVQKSCPPYTPDNQWVLCEGVKHGYVYIIDHINDHSSGGIIYYDATKGWYYRERDLKLYDDITDLPLFKEIVNE